MDLIQLNDNAIYWQSLARHCYLMSLDCLFIQNKEYFQREQARYAKLARACLFTLLNVELE